MILTLSGTTVQVTPMRVPEPFHKIYLEYVYETGTNHLQPRLQIHGEFLLFECTGDRMFINIGRGFDRSVIHLTVDLLDVRGIPIRTYTGEADFERYCTIGDRPVSPDLLEYIHELEQRVAELMLQGEVI